MSKKMSKLSAGAIEVLEMLKVEGSGTAHSLKGLGIENLNSAHLKALENRGLVSSKDVHIEVEVIQKRKVKEYTITELGKSVEVEEQKA